MPQPDYIEPLWNPPPPAPTWSGSWDVLGRLFEKAVIRLGAMGQLEFQQERAKSKDAA